MARNSDLAGYYQKKDPHSKVRAGRGERFFNHGATTCTSLAIKSGHGKAALYLGHCFKSRNNWRLAQRNFEEALQKLPANDETTRKDILFQLANIAADSGDLAKAIDLAHEVANLDFAYRGISRLMDEWQAKLLKA